MRNSFSIIGSVLTLLLLAPLRPLAVQPQSVVVFSIHEVSLEAGGSTRTRMWRPALTPR
jgi:hypothetical protein